MEANLFEQHYDFRCRRHVNAGCRLLFFLLGCGGTGSKLAPELCQAVSMVAEFDRLNNDPVAHTLMLIDHDTVEPKNLVRQNFIKPDLGKNKAEVLASRYSRAFGLEVACWPHLIDDARTLCALIAEQTKHRMSSHQNLPIIITAVDNHQTRKIVHNLLVNDRADYFGINNHPFLWIDLGNEATAGQVVFGYKPLETVDHPPPSWRPNAEIPMPFVTEIYPEILTTAGNVKPSELACGEGGLQDLNVNAAAAVHAISFVRTLLKALMAAPRRGGEGNIPICNYHGVEFGVRPPSAVPRLNTMANFLKVHWATPERERGGPWWPALQAQREAEEDRIAQAAGF